MKTNLYCIALAGMVAACASRASSNSPAFGGQTPAPLSGHGPGHVWRGFSIAYSINNAGQTGGAAGLPNGTLHVTGSAAGGNGLDGSLHKTDLGTLGGPNSAANRPNGRGDVPIISETSAPDPLGEDFCNFATHLTCLGALWS